jgi:signal transduction histidine kinase
LIRDEVYRISREALINAFRHSGAAQLEVEIEFTRRALRVLVRDDGRGIDPEVLRAGREGHWGLSGMRERAERVGASLRVWSRAGAGTEVELSVPAEIAFHRKPAAGPPGWLSRLLPGSEQAE